MSYLSRRSMVSSTIAGLGLMATAGASTASATSFGGVTAPATRPSGTRPFSPVLSAGWSRNPFLGLTLNTSEKAAISSTEAIQRSAPEWTTQASFGLPVKRTVVTSGDIPPIPVLVHTQPNWYSSSVGTLASGTVVLGIYVNLDWIQITTGTYKNLYVASGNLHRSDLPLPKNGTLSVPKIAPVPMYLRHYPHGSSGAYLNPQGLKQIIWLNAAYRRQFGSGFVLNEGYRSTASQVDIYGNLGPGIAATPGTSNHELGIGVDIDSVTIGGSPGSQWMNTYANAFGWQRPAVFDRTTTEFWHYNYVG